MPDHTRPSSRFRISPLLFVPLLLSASLIFAAPATPANDSAPAAASDFSSSVTVRAGEVDAVVTNKDGNPVSGLTVSDFKVLLDGSPVKVDLFEEVGPASAASITGAGSPQSGTSGASAAVKRVPRNFLIFIDDAFLTEAYRNPLLRRLSSELSALGPQDRVAVVAYNNDKLETLTGWTGSAAAVRAALAKAEATPPQGVTWITFMAQFDSVQQPTRIGADRTQYGRFVTAIKHSVLASASAMRRFDPGNGKKVLVLVTGGWPENPYSYLANSSPHSSTAVSTGGKFKAISPDDMGANSGLASTEKVRENSIPARGLDLPLPVFFPPDDVYGGEDLFRPLTDTADLLGYVVYGANPSPGNIGSPAGLRQVSDNEAALLSSRDRLFNVEGSLVFAAHATGGRALFQGNADSTLKRAVMDLSTYYRLGFKLPSEDRAVRHSVKVEVLRPGLTVRARRELVQAPEQVSPELALADALAVGTPLRDRGVSIETGKITAARHGELRVPLTIKVPWSLLEVTPEASGRGYTSSFKIAVRAQNESGGKSVVAELPVHAKVPGRPPEGSVMVYQTTIALKRGKQRIGVAAYDPKVGEVGVAVASLDLK